MRAILTTQADLLWFGGIGTYVRASRESDGDVGDRANDPIRVAASDLRVRVIGEGANLGMTQKGRIEAAARGVRLNTDFIDNSAGVNTSDQEVNIKIALAPAVRGGRLGIEDRNKLLASMADEVALAVLRNNYQQSLAISIAQRRDALDLGAIARLVRELEAKGLVDRQLEVLPGDHHMIEQARLGHGLSRPEIAVVLSYAKISLLHDLLASTVPDDPYLSGLLADYFPPAMRERFAQDISQHRLRREIVATTLTNGLVNRLGPSMPLALADAAGRPVSEVAFAFMAARGTLGLAGIWKRIDGLDGQVAGAAQLQLYERVRRALLTACSDFLREGIAAQPLAATIERFGAGCRALAGNIDNLLPQATADRLAADLAGLLDHGVPRDVASDLARLEVLVQVPSIMVTAGRAGTGVLPAARAHLEIAAALRVDEIVSRAHELAPSDDYERLAISGGLASLGEAHRRLASACLAAGGNVDGAGLHGLLEGLGSVAARAVSDLDAIAGAREMSASRLAVAAARLTGVAEAAQAAVARQAAGA